MKTIWALGKVAVGTLVVTVLGAAPGCGPSIGAYCDKVCDCTGCSADQRDDCIDTADDARRNADNKGCRGQFDDLLSCGVAELECHDGYTQIDGCEPEQESYLTCMIGKPGGTGSGGYGAEGGYGEGGWGEGGYGEGGWGEGGYGEGGWGEGGYGEGGWGEGGYGEGGYGGYGGSGGSGGYCVGCAEYVTTDEWVDLCEGPSTDLYEALVMCVCDGPCAATCSENLCSGFSPDTACQSCVLDTAEGCGSEYNECANDI